MKTKKVVIISDLHCGHRVGLTPPEFQTKVTGGSKQRISQKFYKVQVALWNAYLDMLKRQGHIDILVVNGDGIDGRGERSGSTELLYVDRNIQVQMAADCILQANADTVLMVRGTPYHTGYSEEYEDNIAEKVNAAKIEDHAWYDINGVIFDVKHSVGSSTIPHGRSTAIKKEALWNLIWAERDEQPKSDIIIRSHAHYFDYSGNTDYLAIITPALQGMGSKFGAKMCSGTVDFGLIYFDITENGEWSWGWDTVRVKEQKAKALKLLFHRYKKPRINGAINAATGIMFLISTVMQQKKMVFLQLVRSVIILKDNKDENKSTTPTIIIYFFLDKS